MGKRGWIFLIIAFGLVGIFSLINLTGYTAITVGEEGIFPGAPSSDRLAGEQVIPTPPNEAGDSVGYTCGNGVCESGESLENCPMDCETFIICGNNICDSELGENLTSCPGDCNVPLNVSCGNGVCETVLGENNFTCFADCGNSDDSGAPQNSPGGDDSGTMNGGPSDSSGQASGGSGEFISDLEDYSGESYKICVRNGVQWSLGTAFGTPSPKYKEPLTLEDCEAGNFSPPEEETNEPVSSLQENLVQVMIRAMFGLSTG